MSSSTDTAYSTSLPPGQTETAPNQPDGVLSSVKQQVNSVTDGASLSEISSKVTAVAGEKANGMKDTVVPAAGEALNNVQGQIRSLAGGGTGADTYRQDVNSAADAEDQERVDQMSTEQVCDFLRAKHLSNRSPPSTN